MTNQRTDLDVQTPVYEWSKRILIAAIAGILFLTLLPFRFAFGAKIPGIASAFLLGSELKSVGPFNAFLNVLLFVPFGFGLSEKLRERGKSPAATAMTVLMAGAMFSYAIEFAQIYIPSRDSGWEDVLTNSTGSVMGFLFYELLGGAVLRCLMRVEAALDSWLSLRRVALVLPVYLVLWFAISVQLQKDTRLTNWDPKSPLLIGNDASGRIRHAWKGKVLTLQLWDRALPDDLARNLTSGQAPDGVQSGQLATYHFSGAPPFQDQRKFIPDLFWATKPPTQMDSKALYLNGESWLTTEVPVTDLVTDLVKAKQFSVRVVCAPAEIRGVDARIASISEASGLVNLSLGQTNADLVLWFRTPLSLQLSHLAFYVPNVFATDQLRDILYSYDGSDLCIYIDGKKVPRTYRLGPGTSLAHLFRKTNPSVLEGYNYLYYSSVFLPVGFLLGLAGRKLTSLKGSYSVWLIVGFVLAPEFLEFILAWVSGRSPSIGYTTLSLFLAVGGFIWINADRRCRQQIDSGQ